jgi:hypothetical protein
MLSPLEFSAIDSSRATLGLFSGLGSCVSSFRLFCAAGVVAADEATGSEVATADEATGSEVAVADEVTGASVSFSTTVGGC